MSSTETDNVANPDPTDPNKTPPQPSAELQLPDNTPISQKHSSLRTGGYHKGKTKKELAAMEMLSRMAEIKHSEFMVMLRARSKECGPEDVTLKELDRRDAKTYMNTLSKFKYAEDGIKEDDFYPLLCETIQGMFDLAKAQLSSGPEDHATPKRLVIVETAHRADLVEKLGPSGAPADPGDDSPSPEAFRKMVDLSIYRDSDAEPGSNVSFRITDRKRTEAKTTDKRRMWLGVSRWYLMAAFVEVKKDAAGPFSLKHFLFDTKGAKEGRGQIAEYAAEIRLRQHRVFLYSVSVQRHTARLIYWDQAGVLVSESLDFKANPYDFLNFFYLLGQMNDTQLGLDPNVTLADDEDTNLWDSLYKDKENEHLRPRLDAARRQPLVKVEVNGDSLDYAARRWTPSKTLPPPPPPSTRTFLLGMYAFGHSSLTGRGTKGYIALEVAERRFVYLKDYWRVDHTRVRPEMVIYAHLRERGVEYIADIVCGGDVDSCPSVVQITRAQRHIPKYRPQVHTRIVILQIGRRLNEYKNSRELAFVMRDALRAHQQAWEKAGVLHRDINDGNIIIDDTKSPPTARLIDWEQAKYLEDLNNGATNAARSGTWAFLSGLVSLFPLKKYELADDLESFMQLSFWLTWRFHWHEYSQVPDDLAIHIGPHYFAVRQSPEGYQRGFGNKMREIRAGTLPFQALDSPAHRDLLDGLLQLFKAHYDLLDHNTLTTVYDTPSLRRRPQTLPAPRREELIQQLAEAVKDSPLQTHGAMLKIFDDICERDVCTASAEEASGRFDWSLDDKVPDQFKDIPELQISKSTTKRVSTQVSEEVDGRAVKRARP